jgi:hypothetical protein
LRYAQGDVAEEAESVAEAQVKAMPLPPSVAEAAMAPASVAELLQCVAEAQVMPP